jgi:hypothetical protein
VLVSTYDNRFLFAGGIHVKTLLSG